MLARKPQQIKTSEMEGPVWLQDPFSKRWTEAEVREKVGNQQFRVVDNEGRDLRVHRDQVRPAAAPVPDPESLEGATPGPSAMDGLDPKSSVPELTESNGPGFEPRRSVRLRKPVVPFQAA